MLNIYITHHVERPDVKLLLCEDEDLLIKWRDKGDQWLLEELLGRTLEALRDLGPRNGLTAHYARAVAQQFHVLQFYESQTNFVI